MITALHAFLRLIDVHKQDGSSVLQVYAPDYPGGVIVQREDHFFGPPTFFIQEAL